MADPINLENIVWIILGIIAISALAIYWNGKNAVWGGLTIGIIIGLIIGIFSEFTWLMIGKSASTGTIIGLGTEFFGKIFPKK